MGRLFHTAGKFHPDAETEGAESLRNQSPELVIEKNFAPKSRTMAAFHLDSVFLALPVKLLLK